METTNHLNCVDARNIDMVDYLASIGHAPAQVKGSNYWYLSPLRLEKTPSFKVNKTRNRWIDFGDGRRGNIIDFAVLYHHCSVKEFLNNVSGLKPTHSDDKVDVNPAISRTITVEKVTVLKSVELLRYLHSRKIKLDVAKLYCREIEYSCHGKKYKAIGFQNDAGGYELRSESFKGCAGAKTITTIGTKGEEVNVFEGFFDMLSWESLGMNRNRQIRNTPADTIVLNSLSFFDLALPAKASFKTVHLYLDNDEPGRKCTEKAVQSFSNIKDESRLYRHYKDLNEWTCHIGKKQTPHH